MAFRRLTLSLLRGNTQTTSKEEGKELPRNTFSVSPGTLSLSPFGSAFTRPTYRPRAGGFVRTQISAAVAAAAEATHVTGRFRSSTGESRLVPPLKKAGEKILSRPCIGEDDLTAETKKKNTRSADFGTKFLSTTRATKKKEYKKIGQGTFEKVCSWR